MSRAQAPEDIALRARIDDLEKRISDANSVAIIAGGLSFFVVPIIGAIIVGTVWYVYTTKRKKKLAVEKARLMEAAHLHQTALDTNPLEDGPRDPD